MNENLDVVAVVGMAARAPGAGDLDQFWRNILAGRDCLSHVDDEPDRPADAGRRWVPVKGLLDDAEYFDASFFGFSPREAQLTDPQQRVFLELAWHALEDAGHRPDDAGRVGVFASSSHSRYASLVERLDPAAADALGELQLRISTEGDFMATRVAYKFDLRGPAVSVQTACSSTLVAVHLAVNALLAGDCDTAIAGGVTITLPLRSGYWHQSGSILSPDGRCCAFDAAAAGTVPGNGGAAIVLRRLADARADGDDIYAVILGTAINNDGAGKIGFTAPSAAGQSAAIASALAVARIRPDHVGLIEAHGTGTGLGDPIELAALRAVFGEARPGGDWCGISASKSNVGHLDAAAGIIGFVKAVAAVRAGVIPPIANFSRPNPDLELERSPFRVVTETTPWSTPGRRVAGVSSFGVGGTNAHVVIAEAPDQPLSDFEPSGEPIVLALSARTPAALDRLAERLADHLDANSDLDLNAVAFTLARGRIVHEVRRTVCATDRAGLVAALRRRYDPNGATALAEHLAADLPVRRVHLPGYPFERERFWPGEELAVPGQPDAMSAGAASWLPSLFADVVGRTPRDQLESFFDMGGDSLAAIQLLSRISVVTGFEPDLDEFFDAPNVAGLCAQIERAEQAS